MVLKICSLKYFEQCNFPNAASFTLTIFNEFTLFIFLRLTPTRSRAKTLF